MCLWQLMNKDGKVLHATYSYSHPCMEKKRRKGDVRLAISGQVDTPQVTNPPLGVHKVATMNGEFPSSARVGPVVSVGISLLSRLQIAEATRYGCSITG